MKYLIASDIHGAADWCAALCSRIRAEEPDALILLGDLLYHGPRNDLPAGYDPKRVIDLLSSLTLPVFAVRGNCEAEVDQMVLPFPVLADYAVFAAGERLLYATHGHLSGPANPPRLRPGDILLCGHTHVPAWEKTGELTYLNPGSVSLPKENSPHAYMTFENGVFTWKTLPEGAVFHTFTPGTGTD